MPETLSAAIAEFSAALDRAATELPNYQHPSNPVAGGWSQKQILGHLIDSASNNHQRFVRAQLAKEHASPGYTQEEWVATQGYQNREWKDLIELWLVYNQHLLHLMKTVPAEHLSSKIRIRDAEPVTLEFVMVDYVDHLMHHLRQMRSE